MFKRVASWFGNVFRRSVTNWVYRAPIVFSRFPVTSGATVNEDTAVSWTAIWRGLQLVGSAIGSMPFTVVQEDDDGNIRTLRGHPLYPIINLEPHPFYSTFDFLQAIVYQVLLRGNAVIVINRIGRQLGSNRPGSLRIVEYDDVLNIRETEDGQLIYTIKGYAEPISHRDIIHIKGVTRNGLYGMDPLQWHRETIGLALAAQETSAKSYRQGTHSDGFLSTETQLDIETRKDLQEAWNAQVNNGETPLLTGGVKWQQISVAPKDIQLLEGRQFNVYEAARLLGVSPHLLFAMDRANFSNVETLSLEFSKFTLRFIVERIEQEFNRKIFRSSEKGRLKVNLNMDAFLRGDTEARANYLQTLLDRGVLTIDEARKVEGFNPHPEEAGKTAMVPMNFQTLEQMNNGGAGTTDGEDADIQRQRLGFETMKAKLDAYGVGVRAGAFTPQKQDENALRKEAGLPDPGPEVEKAWQEDEGYRRPITLKLRQEVDKIEEDLSNQPANDDPGPDDTGEDSDEGPDDNNDDAMPQGRAKLNGHHKILN